MHLLISHASDGAPAYGYAFIVIAIGMFVVGVPYGLRSRDTSPQGAGDTLTRSDLAGEGNDAPSHPRPKLVAVKTGTRSVPATSPRTTTFTRFTSASVENFDHGARQIPLRAADPTSSEKLAS